jgi:hypothetical protein
MAFLFLKITGMRWEWLDDCLVDMKYEINQFLPVPLLLFPLVSLSTLPSTVSLFGKRSHHYLST